MKVRRVSVNCLLAKRRFSKLSYSNRYGTEFQSQSTKMQPGMQIANVIKQK